MKRLLYSLITVTVLFVGCGKDNYKEPESIISGRVTFNGKPLNVKGTGQAIQLKLHQPGYQLNAEVPVYVSQDGSFKVKIFDGKYKLVGRDNNGPWVNATDTLDIDLKGNIDVNYEVNPYYLIESTSLTYSTDNKLTGSFSVVKNISSASISFYTILVSKTAFVDDVSNFYREDYNVVPGNAINVSEDLNADEDAIKEAKKAVALYARVGVKVNGIDQLIYSEVIKIK